jgi:aquaporin Z
MVMIYSFGNVSGAHFNPAVTVSFLAAKRIKTIDAVLYILFQLAGGVLAALILTVMFPNFISLGVTVPKTGIMRAFFMEVILTFMLMTVILNVSTGHMEKGIMAGIAIGGMVALAAAMGGPVTGASMNPARSLAPAIAALNFKYIWIYLTAPFVGSLLAIPAFNVIQHKTIQNDDRNT